MRLLDGASAYSEHSGEVGRWRDVAKVGTSGLNDGVAIIMIEYVDPGAYQSWTLCELR